MNEYQLELLGDSVYFSAENDDEAIKKAKEFLASINEKSKGLKLFRYPQHYTERITRGLIEVPFFY